MFADTINGRTVYRELTDEQKRIYWGLPISLTPLSEVAEELGVSEDQVLLATMDAQRHGTVKVVVLGGARWIKK